MYWTAITCVSHPQVWDLKRRRQTRAFDEHGPGAVVRGLAFSHDDRHLVSANGFGQLLLHKVLHVTLYNTAFL